MTLCVFVFSYTIYFVLMLLGAKKTFLYDIKTDNFLNKKSTDCLRGLAILFIMHSHFYPHITSNKWLFWLSYNASIGVGIFFLLSGYGLMMSKQTKSNYLQSFLQKKLFRIYIPFLLGFMISNLIWFLNGNDFDWFDNIFGFFVVSLPGSITWYLKAQIILYIVFYIMCLVFKKAKSEYLVFSLFFIAFLYMIISYFFGIEMTFYQNTIFFPLGVALAVYKEKLIGFLTTFRLLKLILSFFIMCISFVPFFLKGGGLYSALFLIGTIIFIVILSGVYLFSSKILSFLGSISLELFLSHVIALSLFKYYNYNQLLSYIIFLLISIVLAILINKTTQLFYIKKS